MKNKFNGMFLLSLVAIFFIACSKSDDTPTPNGNDNSNPDPDNVELESEINDFVWKGMNEIYLWQQDVANLADSKDDDQNAYYTFLNSYNTPEALFDALLYQKDVVDRFSFIVDDYIELEKSFQGISKSNGLDFRLGYIGDSNDLFGYVRYVAAGSDAATKDIKRGDFFLTVDGQQLNINNYQQLLFGENDTYTLGMADVNGSTITPNGKEVTLTKFEFTENPILVSKTIEENGVKIGYLMYNSFIADFDDELNNALAQLKSEGITELVLDLRYNGGGRVSSAVILSSIIAAQQTSTADVFTTEQWNDRYQTYFEQNAPDRLVNYFTDTLLDGTPITELNLNRVYVLTTSSTASASELVINGLEPYINVIQIGTNTTGKYTASVTLYDSPNFGRDNANPNHTYAIQPLVLKSANANGVTDYFNGLTPDIEISEDITNMGVLGDKNEPLLAEAIAHITGASGKQFTRKKAPFAFKDVAGSKDFTLLKDNMFIDINRIKLPEN